MDFRWTPDQEALRREVRDFLDAELRAGSFQPQDDGWLEGVNRPLSRKVGARGWIGMTWPKEMGGGGRSYLDRLIVTEELLRYGAPVAGHWFSDRQIGPSIVHYGTPEQRADFLPRIRRGEVMVSLGMSEPGAGSDLAGLQTKAVADGDDFIINGQKVWTSGAQHSDYCYLVARTDPTVPKHKGISEFLVNMKLPGVTVRPLLNMSGTEHFNEIYFDDVRLPKTSLIGELNRGWYQIAAQLDYERSGMERLMGNYPLWDSLMSYARGEGKASLAARPALRHRLTELAIEFEVGRLLLYRVAWLLTQSKIPNYEAAMGKTFCTEWQQRLTQVATAVLGLHSQLMPGSPRAPQEGLFARGYLFAPGYTIQGGTSEILRNIVATRGLGLPTS